MTSRPNSTKLAAVVSAAVVALVCAASAMTAGSQVVDHDKVVEDPQLDYRKYSKEIAADENTTRSRQAAALQSAALSVGEDEAAFHASLNAEAQALNAATPPDGGASAEAPAAPAPAEPPHGLSTGALIALAAIGAVAVLLALLGLSALGKRKSRRRRHRSDEKSVSLVEFARKSDPDKRDG